jgi:hypothetical protein
MQSGEQQGEKIKPFVASALWERVFGKGIERPN